MEAQQAASAHWLARLTAAQLEHELAQELAQTLADARLASALQLEEDGQALADAQLAARMQAELEREEALAQERREEDAQLAARLQRELERDAAAAAAEAQERDDAALAARLQQYPYKTSLADPRVAAKLQRTPEPLELEAGTATRTRARAQVGSSVAPATPAAAERAAQVQPAAATGRKWKPLVASVTEHLCSRPVQPWQQPAAAPLEVAREECLRQIAARLWPPPARAPPVALVPVPEPSYASGAASALARREPSFPGRAATCAEVVDARDVWGARGFAVAAAPAPAAVPVSAPAAPALALAPAPARARAPAAPKLGERFVGHVVVHIEHTKVATAGKTRLRPAAEPALKQQRSAGKENVEPRHKHATGAAAGATSAAVASGSSSSSGNTSASSGSASASVRSGSEGSVSLGSCSDSDGASDGDGRPSVRPVNIKEALEMGGWTLTRQGKHRIYERVVPFCSKVPGQRLLRRQVITMSVTPSDWRTSEKQLCDLRKADRMVCRHPDGCCPA